MDNSAVGFRVPRGDASIVVIAHGQADPVQPRQLIANRTGPDAQDAARILDAVDGENGAHIPASYCRGP